MYSINVVFLHASQRNAVNVTNISSQKRIFAPKDLFTSWLYWSLAIFFHGGFTLDQPGNNEEFGVVKEVKVDVTP